MAGRRLARVRLLPRHVLCRTGPTDCADWNYDILLGFFQRARFRLVLTLLGEKKYGRLVEIGFGSGIFLPELTRHCEQLFAVDIHHKGKEVQDKLRQAGTAAHLVCGSCTGMPFRDQTFDCVVSVSALEFILDLRAACEELKRVLTPGGILIVVTPGTSRLLDVGLRVLTGRSAATEYGDRRQLLMPTLLKQFALVEHKTFPPYRFTPISMYRAMKLRKY